jgi:hypothetical protein
LGVFGLFGVLGELGVLGEFGVFGVLGVFGVGAVLTVGATVPVVASAVGVPADGLTDGVDDSVDGPADAVAGGVGVVVSAVAIAVPPSTVSPSAPVTAQTAVERLILMMCSFRCFGVLHPLHRDAVKGAGERDESPLTRAAGPRRGSRR